MVSNKRSSYKKKKKKNINTIGRRNRRKRNAFNKNTIFNNHKRYAERRKNC